MCAQILENGRLYRLLMKEQVHGNKKGEDIIPPKALNRKIIPRKVRMSLTNLEIKFDKLYLISFIIPFISIHTCAYAHTYKPRLLNQIDFDLLK